MQLCVHATTSVPGAGNRAPILTLAGLGVRLFFVRIVPLHIVELLLSNNPAHDHLQAPVYYFISLKMIQDFLSLAIGQGTRSRFRGFESRQKRTGGIAKQANGKLCGGRLDSRGQPGSSAIGTLKVCKSSSQAVQLPKTPGCVTFASRKVQIEQRGHSPVVLVGAGNEGRNAAWACGKGDGDRWGIARTW